MKNKFDKSLLDVILGKVAIKGQKKMVIPVTVSRFINETEGRVKELGKKNFDSCLERLSLPKQIGSCSEIFVEENVLSIMYGEHKVIVFFDDTVAWDDAFSIYIPASWPDLVSEKCKKCKCCGQSLPK